MPRRKFNPTEADRTFVRTLAAVGTLQRQIARKLGIKSEKTLRKHFRDELDLGTIEANANVAGALYRATHDRLTLAEADPSFRVVYLVTDTVGVDPAGLQYARRLRGL